MPVLEYEFREPVNPDYRPTHVTLWRRHYGAVRTYRKTDLKPLANAINLYLIKEAQRAA